MKSEKNAQATTYSVEIFLHVTEEDIVLRSLWSSKRWLNVAQIDFINIVIDWIRGSISVVSEQRVGLQVSFDVSNLVCVSSGQLKEVDAVCVRSKETNGSSVFRGLVISTAF